MQNFEIITLSQTNCYFLKCKNGYLLIDCGNIYNQHVFITSINRLGIKLNRYTLFVINPPS